MTPQSAQARPRTPARWRVFASATILSAVTAAGALANPGEPSQPPPEEPVPSLSLRLGDDGLSITTPAPSTADTPATIDPAPPIPAPPNFEPHVRMPPTPAPPVQVPRDPGKPTRFVGPTSKPWLDDFPAFVNASGGRTWIVGRSSDPCLSQREASEQAARDASRQIRSQFFNPRFVAGFEADADAWLKSRLASELKMGRLVKDRYVSRVKKPYGELWQEAILVDPSSERLQAITRDYQSMARERHVSRRDTAASIFGLSVVILLVYAVVNMVTKGYFRGPLRVFACLVMGLGSLFLLYLSRAM